jgi:hypothetical protein
MKILFHPDCSIKEFVSLQPEADGCQTVSHGQNT